jgi:hypothetical protein
MIKSFKLFESRDYIEKTMISLGIYLNNFTINDNGSVDVDDNVSLNGQILSTIPFQFGRIDGDFRCVNTGLKSFIGFPYYVSGSVFCGNNNLTSFDGCPKYIGVHFNGYNNKFTSFKGFPDSLNCHITPLYLEKSPVHEIFRLNPCIDFIHMINEYEAIRNKNIVVEDRLRQALEDSGGNYNERIHFNHYQLV